MTFDLLSIWKIFGFECFQCRVNDQQHGKSKCPEALLVSRALRIRRSSWRETQTMDHRSEHITKVIILLFTVNSVNSFLSCRKKLYAHDIWQIGRLFCLECLWNSGFLFQCLANNFFARLITWTESRSKGFCLFLVFVRGWECCSVAVCWIKFPFLCFIVCIPIHSSTSTSKAEWYEIS